ncbi:MAG: peptidoglycan editing factor PgeF [Anaerolineaceae bacterium]|nr:peptidoglycan editing factor PgeF [Anaerolineaceae bacterium]
MYRKESDGLVSYQFESFDPLLVNHAIYTRLGGVSQGPFRSLNLGGTNGDNPEYVRVNHLRLFQNFGMPFESRFDVWQVHGDTIHFTDSPRPVSQKHQPGDGIFTQNPDVTPVMRFADCVPILIHDPVKKVVGLVHAGWQGTLLEVGATAIEAAVREYGCDPATMLVGIGPSICNQCYQIGKDVKAQFFKKWGSQAQDFIRETTKGAYLDLWGVNEWSLRKAGVQEIEQSGICTAENLHEWYSYRKEKGLTGRFAAAISLTPQGELAPHGE